jgi:hypothetical protein
MDAETGGNENYAFNAAPDLFELPAETIVERFIRHLESTDTHPAPISYALDSAVKKKDNRFVLATGSLVLAKGEIPFLLMISSAAAAATTDAATP